MKGLRMTSRAEQRRVALRMKSSVDSFGKSAAPYFRQAQARLERFLRRK
ncbi:MAG: hypothetical protein ACXABY_34325 [Candidatus Thorarchaeota archaeon]|jgi:hypothetical protein